MVESAASASPAAGYGRRVAAGAVVLLLVSVLVFVATQVLPGNAAVQILGRNATPEAVSQPSRELGLDRPAIDQYTSWLTGLLQGHLGHSLAAHEPVSEFISDRIRNSLRRGRPI